MADSNQENGQEKDAIPEHEAEQSAASDGVETDAGEPSAHKEPSAHGESSVGDLASQLDAALEEVAKFKDLALRAEAEMENVRRRASRDVENAHKFGSEKLIQNLLPVIDSLEKGIESAERAGAEDGPTKAIIEGMSLCLKMLVDVLIKEGLSVVDPVGEPFDPNLHQAMSMVENPDMEPNSVVAVMQRGYTLNDRLVRPAMVMVSKAPAGQADSNTVDETV
jgi:molecular chaperone GrpE